MMITNQLICALFRKSLFWKSAFSACQEHLFSLTHIRNICCSCADKKLVREAECHYLLYTNLKARSEMYFLPINISVRVTELKLRHCDKSARACMTLILTISETKRVTAFK